MTMIAASRDSCFDELTSIKTWTDDDAEERLDNSTSIGNVAVSQLDSDETI